MPKSFIAPLSVAVLVALPVILLQRTENTKLKEESETLRTSLEAARHAEREDFRGVQRAQAAKSRTKLEGGGAERYRPGALKEILAESDPIRRVRALLAYAESIDLADIPAALQELRESAPEWDQEAKMLAQLLLTKWAQEDPDGALASLRAGQLKKGGGEAIGIIAGVAARDPRRAAAWLHDPGNKIVNQPWIGHMLAGTIARAWVRQDADAALAWAETLPEKQRAGAYTGVLGTLAVSDPEKAASLAAELEPGEARRHVVGEIAEVWARKAPQEAATWAQSLEGEDQRRALHQTLETWAQNEPAAAAGFLDGRDDVDRYMTAVAGSWARQEPAEAATWLAEQPDGGGRTDAMGHVLWNWANRDLDAAAAWLGEQPDGPARDRGIVGFSKVAFDIDEGSTLSWAIAISDEETRTRSVNHGLREWNRRDPAAAQEWARTNQVEIPEGDKSRTPSK